MSRRISGAAMLGTLGLLAVVSAPGAVSGQTSEYRVLAEDSHVAVVTLRAGLAARLAHDHLVHAERFDATLAFDPREPANARFRLEVRAADLRIDDPVRREAVQPRLLELGILDGGFQSISEDERREARAEMLAEGQLHAEQFPVITVELEEIRPDGERYRLVAWMEVRGERSRVELEGRLREADGNRVRIEAHGATRFTDFGIEPYSAFLGAVRNRDVFHLYLDLVAEPVP